MKTLQALRYDGRTGGWTPGRKVAVTLCAAAGLLLSGCRHQPPPPALPAIVTAPVPPPPTPAPPAMKSPPPATLSDVPPVKVTVVKPKPRTRKRAANAAAAAQSGEPASAAASPAAVEAAPVAVPAAVLSVGELSPGGQSNQKGQQEATDLVVSSERRLEALQKTRAGQQQEQTREVRRFLEQAREALTTGDAEGARTLATKAKLLMDDLEKWAAQ